LLAGPGGIVVVLTGRLEKDDRIFVSPVVTDPRDAQVVEGVAQMHGKSSPFSVTAPECAPVICTSAIDTFRGCLEINYHY
jgi:hypothetical protein